MSEILGRKNDIRLTLYNEKVDFPHEKRKCYMKFQVGRSRFINHFYRPSGTEMMMVVWDLYFIQKVYVVCNTCI